ncbi:CPBP family intramembrane glutamic endopeptidase [Cryobacterium sp. BB307]|uniref:CPBP family intramembrane glutamic endopeptidase n=1 Tax=Cryobacterium sp. BB307 TaxID=2716317 RepID=UPI00144580CE|nr:CPBP family intramembrane glutamic endopeptidase [Cryobacterium sp. BB307]
MTADLWEHPVRFRALRYPVALWCSYLVVVTGIAIAAKALWPQLTSGPGGLATLQVALQALITLLVVPFVAMTGWRAIGMMSWPSWRDLAALSFPVLTILFGFFAGFRVAGVSTVVLAIASVALAGFSEELAFRGVFLRLLQPRGIWPAVGISSAMFGLMHLTNLALGSPWYTALLQVAFSTMAGFGYSAMRLRTRSLWIPILLHSVYDLTFRLGNVEPGSAHQYAIFMLHGVGWLIYAVVILRPSVRWKLRV